MAPFRTFARFMMVMATMTERTLNLVVPLAHKATAMRLTLSTIQDYRSSVAETKATGIGVLKNAAMSRDAASSAAFLSSGVSLYGRPGGRSRKARRCVPGTPTPVSAAHPIGVGREVHNLNRRTPTMNTAQSAITRHHTLCLHHSSVDLHVSSDEKPQALLEQASLWLAQSREIFNMIANAHETEIGDEIWGAITLLEMAKGLIDHAEVGQ